MEVRIRVNLESKAKKNESEGWILESEPPGGDSPPPPTADIMSRRVIPGIGIRHWRFRMSFLFHLVIKTLTHINRNPKLSSY